MARFAELSRKNIDATGLLWRDRSLISDRSFTRPEEFPTCWSPANVRTLRSLFLDNPLEGQAAGGTFVSKWAEQLSSASPEVRLLAGELLLVYYLPTETVGFDTKLARINDTIRDDEHTLDRDSHEPYVQAMHEWIGNPGSRYNVKQDLQIAYLIDFCDRVKQLDEDARRDLLIGHPWALDTFADATDQRASEAMRHLVCHLLYPDEFERVASGTHKRDILRAFLPVLDDHGEQQVDGRTDDRTLFAIRERLASLRPGSSAAESDYYREPLDAVWRAGDDTDGMTPLAAVMHKKQIVFYGPPGTGKTFQARRLAETLIRRAALERQGVARYFRDTEGLNNKVEANITRLQLHPGIGYPEFMLGLQLRPGGETTYESGIFLRLLKQMEAERDLPRSERLPHVLILDEINRTDLSAMFGEAFSALEADKRNTSIQLPGTSGNEPFELSVPDDLYVIGTMNEIDHSVESLDFALRRRFLWFNAGFDRAALFTIWESAWKPTTDQAAPRVTYASVRDNGQLDRLADSIEALNTAIAQDPDLGPEYELGHAFFADLPFYVAERWPSNRPAHNRILWDGNDKPLTPLESLWSFTVEPILSQYYTAADNRSDSLARLKSIFFGRDRGQA